ncbi:CobW family GTP-binding protein [Nitrospira moscoviensis]|uniref:Putative P-loop guanosine triphosphatase, CobW-like n=1 Tax=Nitrospira moscoviensis TaxID=42253 RepID=A0A0K2GFW2_NITMO|nr:GTP-binding protein [Nitrospira moscoviensis]ALA59836.1 putative P-loop guanosine triphosphatase, CobW-like [Nitrospira moscoviensis]
MPVPFYILCGSLGAGKTTLLMRLLEHWKAEGRRVGVLMNEAGAISIDGPRAGTLAEQVMNLAGGCVCCDTKEDLSWGIAQLVRDYESDVLILECSGLADPAEVVDAVTDLYTARLASLERIIALLHPVSAEASHSSAYVTAQAIRCADELILNKRDLYVPGHWERFKADILAQNSFARLWETSHARLDPSALLAPRHTAARSMPTNVVFGGSRTTEHRTRASYHPIATTVRLPGPLDRDRFLAWSRALPTELERAKGFFRFAGGPELQEFQYAPPGEPAIAPVMLLDEPEPAVVLIGRGYDVDACAAGLLACADPSTGPERSE